MSLSAWAAQVLLLLLIPASVNWMHLTSIPGMGTVALADAMAAALWLLTALHVAAGTRLGWRRRTAAAIAALPLVMAVLGGIAALLYSGQASDALLEFSLHAKKYGLAAIIPLALAVFPLDRFAARARPVIALTLVTNSIAVLFPDLKSGLPITARPGMLYFEEGRSTGLVSNPNDLAYISIGLAVLYFALTPEGRRTVVRFAVGGLVLASVCFNVISSASRSGMFAAGLASLFFAVRRRAKLMLRATTILAVVVALMLGLRHSASFAERTTRAYELGFGEGNLAGRAVAQASAVAAAVEHPFGVGSRNAIEVARRHGAGEAFLGTSDSMYLDTLLAAGFLGLAALLLLLHRAWALIAACEDEHRRVTLQAGFIAFLIIGLASVSPASVFVAPVFFFLIAASCLWTSLPEANRA